MVEFILISEDFPAKELNEQLGIENCEIDHRGDVKFFGQDKQHKRIETHTSITYSTGYIETNEVSVPLQQMYDMLISSKRLIREYIEKYKITAKFWITLDLTESPVIEISKEFIELASYLHSFIEFDIII